MSVSIAGGSGRLSVLMSALRTSGGIISSCVRVNSKIRDRQDHVVSIAGGSGRPIDSQSVLIVRFNSSYDRVSIETDGHQR